MTMILIFCIMSSYCVDASFASDSPTDDNETFTVNIYDNFFGLANLMYGDVTKLDDLFLPPQDSETNETDDIKDEQELAKRKAEVFKFEEFDMLRPMTMTPDVTEFNKLTKVLQNETRRYGGGYRGHTDHEDVLWWKWMFPYRPNNNYYKFEIIKKDRMSNMQLQWLVHARIAVKKALVLKKDYIRTDKRYKIGYLISRLRIIKHEQQKITSFAQELEKHSFRSLKSSLKLYEKMVRYDVDIKDTVRLIRALDKEPIPTTTTTNP